MDVMDAKFLALKQAFSKTIDFVFVKTSYEILEYLSRINK